MVALAEANPSSINLADITTTVSVIVAALAVLANILFQILAARRERDKIRFGIVYEEQFRVCKELYTRLSRLRDAVEYYTDASIGLTERQKRRSQLERIADAFRRFLRQNDVILDESLAKEVEAAWTAVKNTIYDYDDARDPTSELLPNTARKNLLAAIDNARRKMKPHIRKTYGIGQE